MVKVPKKLIEETKPIVRFYFFLRYACGLKEADRFSAKELKSLLEVVRRGIIYNCNDQTRTNQWSKLYGRQIFLEVMV